MYVIEYFRWKSGIMINEYVPQETDLIIDQKGSTEVYKKLGNYPSYKVQYFKMKPRCIKSV